jgi:hypothetical protein
MPREQSTTFADGIATHKDLENMQVPEITPTPNAEPDAPEKTPEKLGLDPLAQNNLSIPEICPGVGLKCQTPTARSSTADAKPDSINIDFEAEWKQLPSEVKAHAAMKCRSSGQDWNSVSWEQKFKLVDCDALSNEMKQKLCALELLGMRMGHSTLQRESVMDRPPNRTVRRPIDGAFRH